MRIWRTVIVFCALALGVLGASPAQAAQLSQVIQQRYEKLHSFTAEFEQSLTHKESGAVEKRQGSLHFMKPLLIRWQTAKPHEEALVITAKEIWDYLPDEEVVYRYPLTLVQDSRSIIQVITGQAALSKDFEVKAESAENGLARLRLFPKEPSPQMVEAMIWVEAATGYIRRAAIVDFYGNSNDVRFTAFTPDAGLSSASFNFTPPKGVEVEDRINSTLEEKELFK